MPRNYESTAKYTKPDPVYGSLLATKIINKIMLQGKRSTAQRLFYRAVDAAARRIGLGEDERSKVFEIAIDNVRPAVEVRSKRVGGANYQVPHEVKRHRQQSLAIRSVVENARKKRGKPMHLRLADEFTDAYNNQGASVQWKENTHKMADANRAYSHFAF